jgi:hypothetical protein
MFRLRRVISAGTGIEPPFTTLPKDQIWRYVLVITGGFLAAYVSTRSSILIGDGRAFVEIAQAGDPAHLHFGEPSHFLQVPLTRAIWLTLTWLGMPVSLDRVLVTMSLAGTLATTVFIGLIASELLDSQATRWLAALLFAASLNAWTQWNGELYGLGLGFVTAGLFFTLRGHVVVPAALWALSVLCRAEFGLAAPAFAVAVSVGWPACGSTRERKARIAALLALAAVLALAELLAGSWMLGRWSNGTSLVEWLQRSVDARERDIGASPEVFRAMKGLVTAFSVAGHYARDLATARGAITDRAFLGAAGAGLLVLGATAGFVAIALGERRLVPFALAWLLPFHVCINWWFLPTVEKYHAAALPPFVLLVTAGRVRVGRRVGGPSWRSSTHKRWTYGRVAREASRVTSYADRLVQFDPLPGDTGVLRDRIEAPDKRSRGADDRAAIAEEPGSSTGHASPTQWLCTRTGAARSQSALHRDTRRVPYRPSRCCLPDAVSSSRTATGISTTPSRQARGSRAGSIGDWRDSEWQAR